MPEPTQITFNHKEVATALLKENGIHEGIWGVFIKFGIRGMNVGASDDDLMPSAIVPVLSIGLQKFDKVNNLSVDAAAVNPREARAERLIGAGKTKSASRRGSR
jgi:hypothetical protein